MGGLASSDFNHDYGIVLTRLDCAGQQRETVHSPSSRLNKDDQQVPALNAPRSQDATHVLAPVTSGSNTSAPPLHVAGSGDPRGPLVATARPTANAMNQPDRTPDAVSGGISLPGPDRRRTGSRRGCPLAGYVPSSPRHTRSHPRWHPYPPESPELPTTPGADAARSQPRNSGKRRCRFRYEAPDSLSFLYPMKATRHQVVPQRHRRTLRNHGHRADTASAYRQYALPDLCQDHRFPPSEETMEQSTCRLTNSGRSV